MVAATDYQEALKKTQDEDDEEEELMSASTSTRSKRGRMLPRRRRSSVRFMDRVSVRKLELEENTNRKDLFYSAKDFLLFKQQEQQDSQLEKMRQKEAKAQAKARAKQERKLKIQQRKEKRLRELENSKLSDKNDKIIPRMDKSEHTHRTTRAQQVTASVTIKSKSKSKKRVKGSKNNLQLGDFLAKNKNMTPVEQAEEARDAISVF